MASLGSIRYAATRPYRIQSLDDKVRLLNEDLTVQTTSEPVSPLRTVGGAEAVRLAVVVSALGVVFGDIGTSPIYTLATVFNPSDPHPVPLNTGQHLRRRVTALLVGDDHRHADLRHPGDARRQRRRGRHHGAHHAAAAFWRARGTSDPRRAGRAGYLRCRAVLRRQHDHPRDVDAVGGRGPQGRRTISRGVGRPDHRGDQFGAVRGSALRHARRRSAVRSGDDRSGSSRSAPAA